MYYEKKISAPRGCRQTACALQLKSIDETGRFAGYASVFGVIDNQHDLVQRGAFERSLSQSRNVKLLWQHQQNEPIGVFDRIFEDENGLYVEGRLLLDVRRGREAYTLLKTGAVSGLSIGYSPVKYHIDAQTGVRHLSDVDLWEVSLVTFPANTAANVTVVKHAEPILSNDEILQWRKAAQLAYLSNAIRSTLVTLC